MYFHLPLSNSVSLLSETRCQHNTAGSPTEQLTDGKIVYAKQQQIVYDQHRQAVRYEVWLAQ